MRRDNFAHRLQFYNNIIHNQVHLIMFLQQPSFIKTRKMFLRLIIYATFNQFPMKSLIINGFQ